MKAQILVRTTDHKFRYGKMPHRRKHRRGWDARDDLIQALRERPRERKRVRDLERLRGMAVAMVVVGHYVHHPALRFFGPQWGWVGVNLFFVLSGFLITNILLNTRQAVVALKTFYARRALRIFPLYYLVLTIYFVASACVARPQPWHTVAVYVFFLQAIVPPWVTHLQIVPHPAWVVMGFSVLWTLSVEELFYLLWAPIVLRARAHRKWLMGLLAGILLLAPAVRFFSPDPRWIQEAFWGQMDSIAAGAMLAMLWMHHADKMRRWAQARTVYLLAGSASLVGGMIWIDLATGIPTKTYLQLRIFDTAAYSLLWAAWLLLLWVVLATSGGGHALARLLRHRVLVWLGAISYCLYLVHYPIYLFWRGYLPHSLALVVALATSLAVATLSWRWLETPIAARKQKRFPERQEQISLP